MEALTHLHWLVRTAADETTTAYVPSRKSVSDLTMMAIDVNTSDAKEERLEMQELVTFPGARGLDALAYQGGLSSAGGRSDARKRRLHQAPCIAWMYDRRYPWPTCP